MTLPLVHSGKVRDIYDAGDGLWLMVASDRISAFDVVLPEPIPEKGRVLTALSVHWLADLADLAPSHLISADPREFPEEDLEIPGGPTGGGPQHTQAESAQAEHTAQAQAGRAMLVRRAQMLPIECIVRGFLAGSGWAEYRSTQTLHGMPLPAGLRQSDRLPEPLFTPSTKAAEGHDENISFEASVDLVGKEVAEKARDLSVEAYRRASAKAEAVGLMVADTKFELGFIDGELAICDEVLTPDSSRFWPADAWVPGSSPPSFDKQPVRDWLEGTGWDKSPPPPSLPPDVVSQTSERYITAYERLSGKNLADWYRPGA